MGRNGNFGAITSSTLVLLSHYYVLEPGRQATAFGCRRFSNFT
jgi:hypothetical protein